MKNRTHARVLTLNAYSFDLNLRIVPLQNIGWMAHCIDDNVVNPK